jgi:hypothetical protein
MNRNSTTIFIESSSGDIANPCITPIPWFKNAPDFTGITEPTLSVLKAVYESSKDNVVVVADLALPQILQPDWEGFKNHLDTSGIYQQMLEADFSLATDAFQAISFIMGEIEVGDNIRQINIFYQVFVQKSPPELIKALSEAIARFNIPIQIS